MYFLNSPLTESKRLRKPLKNVRNFNESQGKTISYHTLFSVLNNPLIEYSKVKMRMLFLSPEGKYNFNSTRVINKDFSILMPCYVSGFVPNGKIPKEESVEVLLDFGNSNREANISIYNSDYTECYASVNATNVLYSVNGDKSIEINITNLRLLDTVYDDDTPNKKVSFSFLFFR